MKNIRRIVLLLLILVIPFVGKAKINIDGYNYTNLYETLRTEGIKTSGTYSQTSDGVNIYLLWGKGCPHCSEFISFLKDYYKDFSHINLYAFETWYDTKNQGLVDKVKTEFGTEVRGVPFIVIGDKYFSGYASTMNDELKTAIKNEYNKSLSERVSHFISTKNTTTPPTTTTTTTHPITTGQVNNQNGKVKIYVFHGDGCPHCSELKKYITEKLDYDDRVKGLYEVVYYEVWYNEDNSKLMTYVNNKLNNSRNGVPLIVIGDSYLVGYANSYDEKIVELILSKGNSTDLVQSVMDSHKEITPIGVNTQNVEEEPKTDITNFSDEDKKDNQNNTKNDDKKDNEKVRYIIIAVLVLVIIGIVVFLLTKVRK